MIFTQPPHRDRFRPAVGIELDRDGVTLGRGFRDSKVEEHRTVGTVAPTYDFIFYDGVVIGDDQSAWS